MQNTFSVSASIEFTHIEPKDVSQSDERNLHVWISVMHSITNWRRSFPTSAYFVWLTVCVTSVPELRSCVKMEVDVLGSLSLMVRTVYADVKQHWTVNVSVTSSRRENSRVGCPPREWDGEPLPARWYDYNYASSKTGAQGWCFWACKVSLPPLQHYSPHTALLTVLS